MQPGRNRDPHVSSLTPTQAKPDDEINIIVGDGDDHIWDIVGSVEVTLHRGSMWGGNTSRRWCPSLTPVPVCSLPTYPASLPHGILEELRQDVVQRHRDEGETGGHVSIDADAGGIAILVFTQASVDRSRPSP